MIVYKDQGINWHPQSDSLGVSSLKWTHSTPPLVSGLRHLVESLGQIDFALLVVSSCPPIVLKFYSGPVKKLETCYSLGSSRLNFGTLELSWEMKCWVQLMCCPLARLLLWISVGDWRLEAFRWRNVRGSH